MSTNDHIQGDPNASLELMEYADYQCPYCKQADQIIKEIKKQLGNGLKFVFRNFPLSELHEYAVHAAVAAEAAGRQHKFWEMHDIIFENQKWLNDNNLFEYATEIGLNMKQFEQDIKKESIFRKIKSDYEIGIRHGVEGTPTFFINGKLFKGNWMDPAFIDELQSLIK